MTRFPSASHPGRSGRPHSLAGLLGGLAVAALLVSGCNDSAVPLDATETYLLEGGAEIEGGEREGMAATRSLRIGSTGAQAMACQQRLDDALVQVVDSLRADSTATSSFRAGEDPLRAAERGLPLEMPAFMDESILPCHRIVAYYGNPLSTRMGVLGEYETEEMLRRFRAQIAEWEEADPDHPVQPALHLVAVVAQPEPGTSGHYRTIMRDTLIERVYSWAQEAGAILILDIQVGTDDLRNVLPRMEKYLVRPDVHLGVDPEFMMKDGTVPGRRIGTMDATDINYASEYLAGLVREHGLPPKVFIVHRFTQGMVTNYQNVQLRPEVQIVAHMDGWGRPFLKRDTYDRTVVREPIQFPGFKIFYHHDVREGDPLLRPRDLMALWPPPIYIQYQ
jgi:hypothetical protein